MSRANQPNGYPSDHEFTPLWIEADALWDEHESDRGYGGFVASDYSLVYDELLKLRNQAVTVLEWGSGLGVVAIMAARLGFDAFGIEIEPSLVDESIRLASKYDADVHFATGNFIPPEYEFNPEVIDEDFKSQVEAQSGYDELDMELRDFDLVFAYPWPTEQALLRDVMRQCGGPNSLFMCFDVREGIRIDRMGAGGMR